MATLKISYDEIRREVGRQLGIDRDPTNWSTDQGQDVADAIQAGLRRVYFHAAHVWSFLSGVTSLSTVSGTSSYPAPSDFIRITSDFTYAAGSGADVEGSSLRMVTPTQMESISLDTLSEKPRYVSVIPDHDGTYSFRFHPQPDAAYSLSYRYLREPDTLAAGNQFHEGPASFSELILASIRLECDQRLNPEALNPLYAERFIQLLDEAIKLDLQLGGPA